LVKTAAGVERYFAKKAAQRKQWLCHAAGAGLWLKNPSECGLDPTRVIGFSEFWVANVEAQ
jgi:hypothetical protein